MTMSFGKNLAPLIGRIAASHHRDRTSLDQELPNIQGAPGFMPQEWSIKAVKIACLLRCADAIQIDQRRASAFALAIHDPRGEFLLHWQAQQLAQPIVRSDDSGPGALVFTSQNDFTEEKADAWWVAYDLIKVANEELQGCYQLMKDEKLPAFTVDRVAGAESPRHLSKFIRTSGWRPVNAEVRVASVEQIIRLLGGEALYGRDPAVPLRELIQNASDAVRARRKLFNDKWYEGKVVVTLRKCEIDGFYDLIVEDDGIGMSEHILTGPLIEFGKSFWASQEAQEEFPGLLSAHLNQAGRFGIGFFSTLMVADRITVTSRRWDAGRDEAHTLIFRQGLRLRPLISQAIGPALEPFSTRVELRISSEDVSKLLRVHREHQDSVKTTLKELIAHLCPCVDCDVWAFELDGEFGLAHSRRWQDSDALNWVRDIVFADSRQDDAVDICLAKIAPNIRLLNDQDGEPCGRAAIAFGYLRAGIASIGGFVSGLNTRSVFNFSQSYVGALSFEPNGPRRDSGPAVAPTQLRAWATEQAKLLSGTGINDLEKYLSAINIAEFGGDSSPIAMALINRKLTPLMEVYNMLADGKEIFAPIDTHSQEPTISMIYNTERPGLRGGFTENEIDFAVITMEKWSSPYVSLDIYHRIPTGSAPTDLIDKCFISCLRRHAESKSRTLRWEVVEDILFARYKGERSPRQKLEAGMELRAAGLRLWLP